MLGFGRISWGGLGVKSSFRRWWIMDGQLRLTSRVRRSTTPNPSARRHAAGARASGFLPPHFSWRMLPRSNVWHPDRSSAQPGKRRVVAGLLAGNRCRILAMPGVGERLLVWCGPVTVSARRQEAYLHGPLAPSFRLFTRHPRLIGKRFPHASSRWTFAALSSNPELSRYLAVHALPASRV